MPRFHEVFCRKALNRLDKTLMIEGICPMTNTICDGGGNRHQTRLKEEDIKSLFPLENDVSYIRGRIPAVCSITYENSKQHWIVCPRRIFSFPKNVDKQIAYKPVIAPHELQLINLLDFGSNKKIGIYPEVYLKASDDDSEINYHFDYIICELLENITLKALWNLLNINDNTPEKSKYKRYLKENGLLPNNASDDSIIKYFPDLNKMAIVEVMTASTSGSNTERGTDIKSSYIKFLKGESYNCPGINKRQVWGRMATQLFSKSAIAESWGAKTYWIVQDKLLEDLAKTTKLQLNSSENSSSTINFVSFKYDEYGFLSMSESVSIDSGINFNGTGKATDILLAKTHPNKAILLACVLKSQLSTVVLI